MMIMRGRVRTGLLAAAAVSISACGPPGGQVSSSGAPDGRGDLSEDVVATVRAEIEEFLEVYRARTGALDVEGLADMYSSSPEFYWVEVGRRTYESAEEIREGLRGLSAQVDDIVTVTEELRVTPLARDAVVVTMRFSQRMSGPGMPELSFSGVITSVVVREGGAWRFLVGHATTESMGGGA